MTPIIAINYYGGSLPGSVVVVRQHPVARHTKLLHERRVIERKLRLMLYTEHAILGSKHEADDDRSCGGP